MDTKKPGKGAPSRAPDQGASEDLDAEMNRAMAESEAIVAADPKRALDRSLPIFQFHARLAIEEYRLQHEAGDPRALLAAIRQCAQVDMVLPEWLARAFCRAFDNVVNCRAGSWDEAFGRPYPKGTKIGPLRKRMQDRWRVLHAFGEIKAKDPRRPVDVGLFEEIGERLGFGATRAAELFYEIKKQFPYLVRGVSGTQED